MKLSTKGRYGLTALLFLARHAGDGPVSLRGMAGTGIQPDYLEQLLGSLRKAGLVNTVRGAQGGYELARPAEEITVGEIIAATEGPIRFCDGDSEEGMCMEKERCDARHVWSLLAGKMNEMLNSITLAGILADLNRGGTDP